MVSGTTHNVEQIDFYRVKVRAIRVYVINLTIHYPHRNAINELCKNDFTPLIKCILLPFLWVPSDEEPIYKLYSIESFFAAARLASSLRTTN